MLLAHHLHQRTAAGKAAGIEDWLDALDAARREAAGEIGMLWESGTGLERRVLKAVAARTVPLTGREAAKRFGLAKSGSTQQAVDRLVAEGHLVADAASRTGWRVADPLLGAWLREDSAG